MLVNDYILQKVLDKIKEIIHIEKFYNTKILIDKVDELPDDIIFKNVILMTSVMKDDNKFYPQIFLEEALLEE